MHELKVNRREFILANSLGYTPAALVTQTSTPNITDNRCGPPLKGFNLDYFYKLNAPKTPNIKDIDFIATHGFNCIRIPFDYRLLFESLEDVARTKKHMEVLSFVVDYCVSKGIHVMLAMHRAPGYCVNPPYERLNLWRDQEAQIQFFRAWRALAHHFARIDENYLSFNLINEPPKLNSPDPYRSLIFNCADEIRQISPARKLIIDGLEWATREVQPSIDLNNFALSARGYFPMQLTHHGASWIPERYRSNNANWPYRDGELEIGNAELLDYFTLRWNNTITAGTRVCIGEWGVFNNTPHPATLNFMIDCLAIWQKLNWGWLLWNFRGPFGVVNSMRTDVEYVNTEVGPVDKKMFALLIADLK